MDDEAAFPRQARVLVAERGATVGLAIAGWLRGWGMTAERVETVAAAHARLAEAGFDLVVADAGLAGLDAGRLPSVTVLAPGDAPPCGRFVARPVQAEALRAAVAAALAPPAGIDRAAIAALWGGTAGTAFRRVAQAFITEAGQRIAAIAASCVADDRQTMEREAHSLAGAAANVGAGALEGLARELELAAASSTPPVLAARARTLQDTAARDLAELRLLLGNRG
jgi:HPt (histidine-containing phosphotransfer) domain-containing protein